MNINNIKDEIKNKYNNMSKEYILNNKNKISINDAIKYKKFTEDELIQLVGYMNLKTALVYQNLSLDFIFRYVLNPEYQDEDNERCITMEMVTYYQKYTIFDLMEYKKNNNITYV
jgi:hypothetical protein